MKTLIAALGLLLAAALPPIAGAANGPAYVGPTYIATVRLTPGAGATYITAFQNTATSGNQDVIVRKIEVTNVTTMTVTSGYEAFWTYVSTSLTHSATLTSFNTYNVSGALATQPSFLTISTAPSNVLLEGESAVTTTAQRNNLTGAALPIIRPLIINLDETATVNLTDSWAEESLTSALPLTLPAGSQRAIVIEKRQFGATDFSVGQVQIRIFYSYR